MVPEYGINIMFQTIPAFQMKLKLWETPSKANNFMHFDTLAKHSPVNSKKHVALLFDLIQEFEKRFQDFWRKKSIFCCICNSILSRHKYVTCQF